jgi:hypothetical protein
MEFIQTFHPSLLKDSHCSLPAYFDLVLLLKKYGRIFSFDSSRDLLTTLLLAQYYSPNTTRYRLWVLTFGPARRFSPTVIHRKEVDRFNPATEFDLCRPVIEHFTACEKYLFACHTPFLKLFASKGAV